MDESKVFSGSFLELVEMLNKNRNDRFELDEDAPERAFDCKKCNSHFTPKKSQWIIYKLCNECFEQFDSQKMQARNSRFFGDGTVKGSEDVEEWIVSGGANDG